MKTKQVEICLIARKDLAFNTRVPRQARALSEAGFGVTVVCTGLPHEEQLNSLPRVRWIQVPMPSPAGFFLKGARQSHQPEATCKVAPKTASPVSLRAISGVWRWLLRPVITGLCWGVLAQRVWRSGKQAPPASYHQAHLGPLFLQVVVPYSRVIMDRLFAHRVVRLLSGSRFDFFLAHDTLPLEACAALSRITGAKVLFDAVELTDNRGELGLLYPPPYLEKHRVLRESRLIRQAVARFATSEAQARVTAELHSIPLPTILQNCREYTEPGHDERIRKDAGLGKGDKLLLQIGAIVPGRGLEELMEAIPLLPDQVKVALLGPMKAEYLAERLGQKARELGVAHRLIMLEPVPPGDVVSYASGADLGVIPLSGHTLNAHLSLPNRLFEMIMARLPMAVADAPAISSLVRSRGLGRIFDTQTPDTLAGAVAELLSQPVMTACKAALNKAARELCWERESQKMITELKRLIREKTQA